MDKPAIQVNFILEWLEQASLDKTLNQDIVTAIKNNMGGVNNESLDEVEILQALLKLAGGEAKDV